MTFDDLARNERKWSVVAAVVMHLLFLALLVFGVSWQKRDTDSAMVVDLWSDLPATPKAEAPPQPVKPPPPPAPKPEPKPVPKPPPPPPPPKPEVKPTVKPDIALKEKREKERKQQELEKAEKARKQKELEAQREKEREKAEQKKREAEKAAQLKAQQQKEAAAKAAADKAAKEQQQAAQRQAAMAAAANAKTIDEYKRRIHDKIQRLVNIPPNVDPKAEVEFDVVVIPGGEVLSAKLKRSSNAPPAYVDAVERAILRAQPLPLPPDPALFNNFRELNLVFRPKD